MVLSGISEGVRVPKKKRKGNAPPEKKVVLTPYQRLQLRQLVTIKLVTRVMESLRSQQ